MSGTAPTIGFSPNPFAATGATTSGGFGAAPAATTFASGFGTTKSAAAANPFGATKAKTSPKPSPQKKALSPAVCMPGSEGLDEGLESLELTKAAPTTASPFGQASKSFGTATAPAMPPAAAKGFASTSTAAAPQPPAFGGAPNKGFGAAPTNAAGFGASKPVLPTPAAAAAPLVSSSMASSAPFAAAPNTFSSPAAAAPSPSKPAGAQQKQQQQQEEGSLVREQRIAEKSVRAGAGKWTSEAAKASQAHNKAQLERLSALVMLGRATTDACDLEATLGLEKRCVAQYSAIAADVATAVQQGEALVAQLKKENALLNPSSGAMVGDDAGLARAWGAKEKDFVDMFIHHRDRYLKLQQGEAARNLAELERDGALAQIAEEERYAFAHSHVAREYLRPDI